MIYILHYANDDLTHSCVDAWCDQGQIVVVDNGSPSPYVPQHGELVHRLEQNIFLIDALNAGMQAYPSATYYLCLNNDVFPCGNVVQRLLAIFSDPDVGVAAPGSTDSGSGSLYLPNSIIGDDINVRHVDNHAFFFTQDVLDEIGYPTAESHTHRANWYSNKEYCYRARMAGYKVVAARSVMVDHRRDHGYDPIADQAGQDWLKQRLGERFAEAW